MPSPRLPPDMVEKNNRNGRTGGCHRCGSKEPGTVSGNFVPDYLPPHALPVSGLQKIYPCCLACSRLFGATLTTFLRENGR
ncbi:hypothetical protein SAMN04488498_103153 [Mesorhizobium albiziae]|uniref:Uncharacterized protein n=1 Tax=Neomesorhizobium albiziae TaxID=335020 RepID=A0A1I3XDC7_9HYPH|nr:hypothetical protein SAMN04488498_103153 [Mesorhizobium albiziae]